MKTKILVPAVLIAGLTLAVATTFAATGNNTNTSGTVTNTNTSEMRWFGMGGHRGGLMGGPMSQLTDAEKTALASMTNTEKQAFFEKKRTEMEAKRDAHEVVVDKLLAGTALTADEEKIRAEIITQRAERKVQKEKMDAIRAKLAAGTTLTTEEQALVDSMPRWGHGGKGGKMRGGMHKTQTNTTVAQ
jgi:Spy/CpxP family protein refolding chaperone